MGNSKKFCDICNAPIHGRFKRHPTCGVDFSAKTKKPLKEMIGGKFPDYLESSIKKQ